LGWYEGRVLSDLAKESYAKNMAFGRSKALGQIYITNGIQNKRQPPDDPIPEGWRRGMVR
jgi:hypothetical protein